MSDTCFRCHGPDASSRMANMRLDRREDALKPNKKGVAPIVPGDPEKSEIVRRVMATNSLVMPPAHAHKELTTKQKLTIRQWVVEGAKYEGHWAYEPIRKPEIPAGYLHPIDAFIEQRLKQERLSPSPEADRRTLIRRVSLDVTGIPPTPAEIAAFVEDRSPHAYEKVVDRLLASPRYAERQAQHWLDAVRYADTSGFHGDNPIPVWPYRDYVLRAFRDNKPFDQFTREQLAGDLIPNATDEQKVASAYNRLTRTSAEGGIQPKEYLAKYAADRVRTTSAVWLAATTGCAECHDHKFDPILAKDFYAMKAFFADIKEEGFVPDRGPKQWGVQLRLPDEAQKQRLAELDAWLGIVPEPKPPKLAWTFLKPDTARTENGAKLEIHNDTLIERSYTQGGSNHSERIVVPGIVVATGPNPDRETYTVTARPGAGEWGAFGLELYNDLSNPGNDFARGSDRVVVTEVEVSMDGKRLPVVLATSDSTQPVPEHPAMAAIDGDPRTGWGLVAYLEKLTPVLALHFPAPVRTTALSVLTVVIRHDSEFRRATTGRFRVALSKDGAAQDQALIDYARVSAERGLLEARVPRVVVSEPDAPKETRILPRGNWMDDSGAIVEPAIPEFLGTLPADRRATRLDLANWIVAKDNPLTARAFANRMWKRFFGTGLSKVLDDLGSQGEPPSHPELLDWMAYEFRSDWDVKRLIRSIVTSAAYKRSSQPTTQSEERDPYNRLLARQSRLRLDAETVRDSILAFSGLLEERFGGPSVRPYQPPAYLAALNFPRRDYSESMGRDQYRRGIYVFWQRTFLHPSLAAFDAPAREECTMNRTTSNTPLQSLVLLNDPIYVEAARAFAQNLIRDGAGFVEAFERALARRPSPEELAVLHDLHAKESARFRKDQAAARELLSIGEYPLDTRIPAPELAAMTSVTRAILNLHETITRN